MNLTNITAFIIALGSFVTASAAAYVKIIRELKKVHVLVNNQLHQVMDKLDAVVIQRDKARDQLKRQDD